MADLITRYSTNKVPTKNMGQTVDEMVRVAKDRRLNFERKWYDNNFFDDGHHYRFLSRSSNKIVDVSEQATVFAPMRAIPKASRQIRGVMNLLVAPDYTPVIYPERVDPQNKEAVQMAKDRAHKVGRWVYKEWQNQELIEKLALMVLLAAKNSVSWMQIWPDSVDEAIKTQVYDAFDIYVMGNLTDPYDSPFMVKGVPQSIARIKANEDFDKDQLTQISPDNKYASSEIKQAYLSTRYNRQSNSDQAATLILNEAYIKEYLNGDNRGNISKQSDGKQILEGKKDGDMVVRQVFTAGGVWLRDRYVNLPEYPFVDFRFEPGPIYQVSLIERFIPTNKSLDALVSRAERYSHTMVTGSWSVRNGEQYKIENGAGGQIFKYASTPPTQNNIAPIPAFFFQLMDMMGQLIEEQGVTTSTLGKLPRGVKANAAIESLKESEYANLVVASRRLQNTVKRITERMLDIADNQFVTPQTVYDTKDGNPTYFDVIGGSALEKRKADPMLMEGISDDVVPLKKDYKVEIEISQGMGYTQEGRKAAAKELGDYMVQLAQLQLLSPEVVKVYLKQLLETYHFGPTEDIMEAMDTANLTADLSEEQLMKIKIAVLEALKEAGEIGPKASESRIMENKVGLLEALKESGIAEALTGKPKTDIKTQAEVAKIEQEMKLKQEEHNLKMAQGEQDIRIKAAETGQDMDIKREKNQTEIELKKETTHHGMKVKEQQVKQMKKDTNGKK